MKAPKTLSCAWPAGIARWRDGRFAELTRIEAVSASIVHC
jgi:hypothetical protein